LKWVKNSFDFENVQQDVVMVSTSDGSGKVELVGFHTRADNLGLERRILGQPAGHPPHRRSWSMR
jgi:hypothetical protein